MTYPEAIEWLAEKAGMKVPESFEFGNHAKKKELTEKIYTVNALSAKFFHENLFNENGQKALYYLQKRGLDSKTVRTFGLGFSPDDPKSLSSYLFKQGYDVDTLKTAGLITINKMGKPHDFFAGRLIVPIIEPSGKVSGFGGRVLGKTDFAKYKNTSSTPVFDKSRTLFSLNLYKKLQQKQNVESMILVEGYMDVISLYQAGIKNTVAPMGTSLTMGQCRIIKRYTDIVHVSFDGDPAGRGATWRSLDMLKQAGLEVKVISMPDGLDPDDVVKKYGADGFLKLVGKALPLIDYKLKTIEESYDLKTFDGRKKYTAAAVEVLKPLDSIEKDVYAKTVSEKGGVTFDTVMSEANGEPLPERTYEAATDKTVKEKVDTFPERYVISALLNGDKYADISLISEELFDDELHQRLFIAYKEAVDGGKTFHVGDFFEEKESSEVNNAISAIMDTVETIAANLRSSMFIQCITKLKKYAIDKKYKVLINMFSSAEDPTERKKIEQQMLELEHEKRKIR